MSSPSTTAAFIVGQLNTYYASIGVSASYAYDPNVDPTTGGTGGGPSGLIYNTNTVQDLGVTFLAYGSSGAPRAGPLRVATHRGHQPVLSLRQPHVVVRRCPSDHGGPRDP